MRLTALKVTIFYCSPALIIWVFVKEWGVWLPYSCCYFTCLFVVSALRWHYSSGKPRLLIIGFLKTSPPVVVNSHIQFFSFFHCLTIALHNSWVLRTSLRRCYSFVKHVKYLHFCPTPCSRKSNTFCIFICNYTCIIWGHFLKLSVNVLRWIIQQSDFDVINEYSLIN